MAIIPRYIPVSYVQIRLYNKINFIGSTSLINAQFSDSDTNVGLTDDQTAAFINQAASFVEYELSPLYIIPFQTVLGIPFDLLNTATELTANVTLTIGQLTQGIPLLLINYTNNSYIVTLPLGYTFDTIQYGNTSTTFTVAAYYGLLITYAGSNIVTVNVYDFVPPSTQDFLNTLIINRSAVLMLQTEFAKDTGIKGDNFIKQYEDQWKDYIDNKLLKRSDEGKYQYPPLLNLATNINQYDLSAPMSGPVVNKVGQYDALNYANRHINDPARKLFYPFFYENGV